MKSIDENIWCLLLNFVNYAIIKFQRINYNRFLQLRKFFRWDFKIIKFLLKVKLPFLIRSNKSNLTILIFNGKFRLGAILNFLINGVTGEQNLMLQRWNNTNNRNQRYTLLSSSARRSVFPPNIDTTILSEKNKTTQFHFNFDLTRRKFFIENFSNLLSVFSFRSLIGHKFSSELSHH